MALASPRPPRAVEAPQKPDSPNAGANTTQLLQNREDVRSSKSVVKRFRRLCRDYDVPYTIEGVHTVSVSRAAPQKNGVPRTIPEDDDASSSSDDDPLQYGQERLGSHARWPQIKELLDKLETKNRVRAVKDISIALNKAALEAESYNRELEALEETSAEDESNLVIDEELWNFRLDNTPAVQAIRRCIDVAPDLYKKVWTRLDAIKQDAAKAAAAAEEGEGHQSDDDLDFDSDEEDGNVNVRGEVLQRLHRLGTLPRSADKELHLVLEVQREEIRQAALRTVESERKVKVARLAVEYIDGSLDPQTTNQDLLNSAITLAQNLKSQQYVDRREEALARRREMRKQFNIPSEVEVQDAIDECDRLAIESAGAAERVERLLETTNPQVESSAAKLDQTRFGVSPSPSDQDQELEVTSPVDGDDSSTKNSPTPRASPSPITVPTAPSPRNSHLSPSHARRRRANRTNAVIPVGLANPCLEINHEDAPEVHKQMKQQLAELEAKLAEQASCISGNESVMRNAEQTLKVLEEMKTLFLEEIAREKPGLIEAFGIVSAEREAEISSESDESGEDELDEEAMQEKLHRLDAEEEFLRFELAMAAEDDEDEEDPKEHPSYISSSEIEPSDRYESERPETSEEDRPFEAIRRLAYRVEQEVRQHTRSSVAVSEKVDKDAMDDRGSGSESDVESERSGEESENEQKVSSEVAAKLLQSPKHQEMQELLQVRDDNSKMLEKLKEVQQEIRDARNASGALDLKLLDNGTTASPEKLEELQQKVRELQVLRKRWWKERQEDQTTVRRALATKDLELGAAEEIEEPPPMATEASLFQRILASMTIP